MNPLAQLQALLQLAETERDTAVGLLRQAERVLQQSSQQTQQLRDYRLEYDQRWTSRFRESSSAELLHCHRGFGRRLDQAIDVQAGNTQLLSHREAQARALLQAREQRVAAVRKLIARRQAEQQKLETRRDQRNSDEAAQRALGSHALLSALSP